MTAGEPDSPPADPGVPTTLVAARTSDGLHHTGALFRPATDPRPLALLWVHGGGQHFYFPTYLRIGLALARRGYPFLSANTRGHDYNSRWDHFELAPLDLAAWLDRLEALGYPRVVLLGHSFSGWRVASYQAERQDPRVRGLVIASTPLRKRAAWLAQRPHYREWLAQAERMVAAGEGDRFLPIDYPQTAASFLSFDRAPMDLYGLEGDPGGGLLVRAARPVLAWFGTAGREPAIGTVAELEEARAALPPGFPLETAQLDSADHMYRGCEEAVAETVARWAERLPEPDEPAAG